MPYASVRGLRLYFEDHGSGPCVIAAHGMLGSVATATVMNASKLAANGLRVIAYDARGHGNSDHTRRPQDYSWSALAEDLHQLMNALGVERATLCGTSMGAGVALMLALTKPSKVERLILRSPPPFGEDPMHPLRSAELIGSSIAGASLHVAPSAQHWTKHPDAFCELVASFVKTDSASSERRD